MPEFLVLGGDAAAAHHVRQLAAAFGPAALRLVDAHWQEAIREWVPRAAPDDQLVPAATMPHLLRRWLAAELGASATETPGGWGLPFELAGTEGELYTSEPRPGPARRPASSPPIARCSTARVIGTSPA